MNATYLYPRLPAFAARARLDELTGMDLEALRSAARVDAPAAAPAATGGSPVPRGLLIDLAGAVRSEFADRWPREVMRSESADVDRRIGRVLHDELRITRSDATSDQVWAYLAVELLPDITAMRFPDRTSERFLGGQRNVFRRTWERRSVLGELSDARGRNGEPLGEDELVNIFERSRMARSHRLARTLAEHVLATDVSNRSYYTRELSKYVKRDLASVNVDVLDGDDLSKLVAAAGRRVRLD